MRSKHQLSFGLVVSSATSLKRHTQHTALAAAQHAKTVSHRDKLMKNHLSLEVDLVHVREFNQELGDGLETKPAEYLPLVSTVAAGDLDNGMAHFVVLNSPAAMCTGWNHRNSKQAW